MSAFFYTGHLPNHYLSLLIISSEGNPIDVGLEETFERVQGNCCTDQLKDILPWSPFMHKTKIENTVGEADRTSDGGWYFDGWQEAK